MKENHVFKGLSNLATLIKQAQQVGSRIQAVNDELRNRRCTGKAGGGMIEAEVDGLGQLLRVSIDPALIERKDREMIEDLVPAAVNAALLKSKELHAEVLRGLTGNIDLPGLKEALAGQFDHVPEDADDAKPGHEI
jgi:hypothetical protein